MSTGLISSETPSLGLQIDTVLSQEFCFVCAHHWCLFVCPDSEKEMPSSNPLQYPCLENPMDRGAWWATVHVTRKELDTTERLTLLPLPVLLLGKSHGQRSLAAMVHGGQRVGRN